MKKSLIELYQILVERFSESELTTLCFHLGVDYDALPGSAKTDKARELLTHLERRQNTSQIAVAGQIMRSDIAWGDATETSSQTSQASNDQLAGLGNPTAGTQKRNAAQASVNINCPRCGAVLEAFCPVMGKTPGEVRISKIYENISGGANTQFVCFYCKGSIYMWWGDLS